VFAELELETFGSEVEWSLHALSVFVFKPVSRPAETHLCHHQVSFRLARI
jgi:hypothetical protein